MTQPGLTAPPTGGGRESSRHVAVIGAGAAGLCTTKTLVEAGHDVTTFEAGSTVGGLWVYGNDSGTSSAYRTLHINTARNLTSFPGFPFDDDVQDFPDHRDMARYLESYADHHGLKKYIRFNSRVAAVVPGSADGDRWSVELTSGDRFGFDWVIVASGHLTKPLHVEAFTAFGGRYLHSHDYREPNDFVGQSICIVGAGNSAVDIASDVCVTATDTVLVARSGVLIMPKLIMGRPFTDITMKLFRPWIPERVRTSVLRFLTWTVHGDMRRLGFKPLQDRAHPTTSATIVNDIAYNRVRVKQGIESINGRTIRFVDGEERDFDVLIAATGYEIEVPFIDASVFEIVDNRVALYQRIIAPDRPGLAFVGMINSTAAPLNWIFHEQALWLERFVSGAAALPSPAEMHASIVENEQYYRRRYRNSPRHTIEEEHVRYMKNLQRSLREGTRRVSGSAASNHVGRNRSHA